jgi:hypothetical protein
MERLLGEPGVEGAELPPRALCAEEKQLVLLVVEVAREVGAPASGQLVAFGAAFGAADDRPLLRHEIRVPTAPMDNTDVATPAQRGEAGRTGATRKLRGLGSFRQTT